MEEPPKIPHRRPDPDTPSEVPTEVPTYGALQARLAKAEEDNRALEERNRALKERRMRELGIIRGVRDAMLRRVGRDSTTSLENRAMYDRYSKGLNRRIEQFKKHPEGTFEPLSFIVVDIDFFKQVNDTHGHTVGDDVLQSVGAAVMALIRANDRVFRYGGEEFVVVCEHTESGGAAILAERI